MLTFIWSAAWWLYLVVAMAMILPAAVREGYRFRLLNSRFRTLSILVSFASIVGWLITGILLARSLGLLSAVVALLVTSMAASLVASLLKREPPSKARTSREWFEGLAEENARRVIDLETALRRKGVRDALREFQRGSEDLRELQGLLFSQGVEYEMVNAAITNARLLRWYFAERDSNREGTIVELVLWARRGIQPPAPRS